MTKQRRADLLLLLTTAFWGTSYYLTNLCGTELPPMTLTAFRFVSAFALLGVVFWKKIRRVNRRTLYYSLWIGLALSGTYIFYAYGLPRTTISNAGFICALAVIFTPLLDFLLHGRRPGKQFGLALVLCTTGLALLTLHGSFRIASGDLLCMGTSLCYAIDLLITEKAVQDKSVDPIALGVFQLVPVAAVTLTFAFILETPRLPSVPRVWCAALFLGIFCTGVAFVIQATQQRYTSAIHVGLIFTIEPVFSTVVAYFFAHEVLRPQGYVGAVLMLLSLVLMEIDPASLFRKRTSDTESS